MDKKLLFNDALAALVEYAAANANHISKEEIHTIFSEVITDENQYELIYKYLQESKIKIDGMNYLVSEDTNDTSESNAISGNTTTNVVETEEETAFINMYKEEMSNIIPATEEEISNLLTLLLDGDLSVTNRLVETQLSLVADIANTFKGQGVLYGDLIQEGNIGLMIAISEFHDDITNFHEYIKNAVTKTLSSIINEQINSSRIGEHLANRMNELDQVSKDLTELLGRAPSFEELGEKLGISTDEVETIVKTSLNVLSSGGGEDSQDDIDNSNEIMESQDMFGTDGMIDANSVDVNDFSSSSFINNTNNELEDFEGFEDSQSDIGDPISWKINKK